MNRVTVASVAFFVFAIAVSAWLLLRTPSHTTSDSDLTPSVDPRAGMTFAEWSARSDAVLLADIDPGQGGASSVPRSFLVVGVKAEPSGIALTDGRTFGWSTAERGASAGSLFGLGFRVSSEGRAFEPPEDPMWSEPVARGDGGSEQTITLRSKSGITASFARRRADPKSAASWNRRAIGFASNDGRLAYVTPDAIVIRIGPP